MMTVKELMNMLSKLPEDCEIYRTGGEYKDDFRKVQNTFYSSSASLGMPSNALILD